MEELFYVNLSQGAYSDYQHYYYVGTRQITQEELDTKGREVGDEIFDWYDPLGEVETKDYLGRPETRKVDPETNEPLYSYGLAEIWRKKMESWLTEQGYKELPAAPELNVAYSEIPTNYKRKQGY